MEISSTNNAEHEDDELLEEEPSKKKRNLPSKFKDFLQSWMDKVPGKDKQADDDAEKAGEEHGWLKNFGTQALELLGVRRPEAAREEVTEPEEVYGPYEEVYAPEETSSLWPTEAYMAPVGEALEDATEAPEAEEEPLTAATIHRIAERAPEPEAALVEAERPEPSPEAVAAQTTERLHEVSSDEPTVVFEHGQLVHPERQARPAAQEVEIHHKTEVINHHKPAETKEIHRQKELKKQTEVLEKQHDQTLEAKKRLEERYIELQQQIKTITKKLELPNSREEHVSPAFSEALPSPASPKTPEKRPEAPRHIPERQVEYQVAPKSPELGRTSQITPERLKEMVSAPEHFASAETILHQVEQAAEKNIPIEKLYERRQEVKDSQDKFTAARSLGSSDWLKPSQIPPELLVRPLGQADGNKLANLWKDQPKVYQQAVKSSAGAALLVVIVVTILMLVFR